MPPTPSQTPLPTIKLSPRGATRLKSGHVWVYKSDIVTANNAPPGSLVQVTDHRGQPLGSALYSSSSQIAIRLISHEPVPDLTKLLRERIAQAVAYRERVVHNMSRDTDAYRIIFSEADFLPGLIVDRYNDILSLQILTQAMDADIVRQTLISELSERLRPASIVERVDAKIRQLEELTPRASGLLQGEKSSTIFAMNGVQFHFDALAGQKTGAFLDQRENYAAAAQYAHGDALDLFCYQGGFALHLAPRCSHIAGVDSSRPALEVADQNAALNASRSDASDSNASGPEASEFHKIEWIEANVFDLLKDYSSSGQRYDTIILDPPAFAKGKKELDAAMRGYKELNLRALKMLRPGGILVTCSCSYHVSQADFVEMLASAAQDARRILRLVEMRAQSKDHPILLNVPETAYLKCVIGIVSN